MHHRTIAAAAGLAVLLILVSALPAAAQPKAPAPVPAAPGRAVVLDTTGFWRMYHELRPPVIRLADGTLKPVLIRQWLDRPTPPAPDGWREVDFDDSTWLRGPARICCRTPYVSRLYVRGRFDVTDPARVRDLALSIGYHGGVVVTVNGREVGRTHLAEGKLTQNTLAKLYPADAFVNAQGGLLIDWDSYQTKATPERTRRLALREREIRKLPIPRSVLRRGANVLTLEIFRAPYDKAVEEKKDPMPGRKGSVYNLAFNTCELMRVQLTAEGPAGLVSQATRPKGLQVWNSDPLGSDFDLDSAGPAEPLYPIRMVGVRGGIFSGKVVVGSDGPIEGLRASTGALKADGAAAIPASAVRVRYGMPWGTEAGAWGAEFTYNDMHYARYPRRPTLLSVLAARPLDVFPVRTKQPAPKYDLATPNQPDPVFGAVVPVWVTVNVPPDAAPGDYRGRLTIRAKGAGPLTVPVELTVVDWTLPPPEKRRTWSELIQVPDTTALEYGAELWSDAHWRMIARSFDLIGETSSRVVHLPLICHTNIGTEQSLVRWIKQTDGSWKHDFSLLERYLDVAAGHMGKPRLVVLYIWEIYQLQPDKMRATSSHDQERRALGHIRSQRASVGNGPVVTTVDSATGKTAAVTLPNFDAPESRALWRPVFAELRKILRERGLAEAAALGCMSDAWPNPEEARTLKALSGGLPWVSYSHMGVPTWQLYDVAEVCYQATVTQNRFANDDPPLGSHHGWAGANWPRRRAVSLAERLQDGHVFAENARGGRALTASPASRLRQAGEFNITGDQRGVGRLGADFWPAVKDRHGNRRGRAADRFPQSSWRNQDLDSSLLGPGPDGPASTHRFEAFREGLQECEARILIEAALTDEKLKNRLGVDLARRCEETLLRRTHYMLRSLGQMKLTGLPHWYVTVGYTYWHRSPGPVGHQWFIGSGWQARSERLYRLAAEVTGKLGRK